MSDPSNLFLGTVNTVTETYLWGTTGATIAYPEMVPPKVFPRFHSKLINIDSSGMTMRNKLRLIPVFVSHPIAVNIILDSSVMIVSLCAIILNRH